MQLKCNLWINRRQRHGSVVAPFFDVNGDGQGCELRADRFAVKSSRKTILPMASVRLTKRGEQADGCSDKGRSGDASDGISCPAGDLREAAEDEVRSVVGEANAHADASPAGGADEDEQKMAARLDTESGKHLTHDDSSASNSGFSRHF